MPESLEDIKAESVKPEPAAPSGRGGARPGSGRKSKAKAGTTAAPVAPDAGEADPHVQAVLEELGGAQPSKDAMAALAVAAVTYVDPKAPPSPPELHVMAVTANQLATKYAGQASSYLSIEAVVLLVWGGILLQRYLMREKPANETKGNPDRGAVGNGQDNLRPEPGRSFTMQAPPGA